MLSNFLKASLLMFVLMQTSFSQPGANKVMNGDELKAQTQPEEGGKWYARDMYMQYLSGETLKASNFITIICPKDAALNIRFAAKEIRRYVYLRTDLFLHIAEQSNGNTISFKINNALAEQQYSLKSDGKSLVISGGSEISILYGVYGFIEKLGVRFQLSGDVIPDKKTNFTIPLLDEIHSPLFERRGIVPFHDFFEGPDWWNADDYKAYVSQMVKMKMNFMGFHCYPRIGLPWDGQEPMVWTGVAGDFDTKNGNVKFSYPTSWTNTLRRTWGNEPGKTDYFGFGASQLFETSDYGPAVMQGLMPMPKNLEESNEMFNRAGHMLNDVFSFSHQFGIKCWVGIELPLWIPDELRTKLKAQGKNPDSLAVRKAIFDAMFCRVKAAYPADGFWFWTGERPDAAAIVKEELLAAHQIMKSQPSPMDMGISGWGDLASHFESLHNTLPFDISISSINNHLGFDYISPEHAKIKNRSHFAIPWLEDDTDMSCPQLFVGRVQLDAADALRYGCNGLMGLHWRTKVISPNIVALAKCGWEKINSETKTAKDIIGTEGQVDNFITFKNRSLVANDFYNDWCKAEFGEEIGTAASEIFTSIDSKLPRPASWCYKGGYPYTAGPGLVGDADHRSWEEAKKEYKFVDKFLDLHSKVKGAGNKERFDYWANQFSYLKAMGKVRCDRYEYDKAIDTIAKSSDSNRLDLITKAIKSRQQLIDDWGIMTTHLLNTVNTPGEMGTVANLELHSRKSGNMLTCHDSILEKYCGRKLPQIPSLYKGKNRLIVPTVRNVVNKNETLNLKIMAMDNLCVNSVTIMKRKLGSKNWQPIEAIHIARAIWSTTIRVDDDMEYYVFAKTKKGEKLVWPASAPEINQTIVVVGN
jgi:hypothetical protein